MTSLQRLGLQSALFLGLLTFWVNFKSVTVASIAVYQTVISPAWGRPCGYRMAYGGESCSAHARRRMAEDGFLAGLGPSLERFEACGRLGKRD